MARNIFAKLIPTEDVVDTTNGDMEAFLTSTLELSDGITSLNAMVNEFVELTDNIDELETYESTITEVGLDKGLAKLAIKSNCDQLFVDSAVSLQGFVDGIDDVEEVKMVMLNGVGEVLKGAAESVGKMLKAIYNKIAEVIAGFFNFTKKFQAQLEKNEKLYGKAEWDKIKDKKLNIPYDGKELAETLKSILSAASVISNAADAEKLKTFAIKGWIVAGGVYTKDKKADADNAKNMAKTVGELNFEAQIGTIFKTAMEVVKAAADMQTGIKNANTKLDKDIADLKKEEGTGDKFKAMSDKIKSDNKLTVSAFKALIAQSKEACAAAIKVVQAASSTVKKEKEEKK